jgi:hypothetical protein
MRHGALLTVAMLVAGCGSAMWASVPVKGSTASLTGLTGKWEGTFEGADASRSGVISFELAQGAQYAEGNITMNAKDPAKATKVSMRYVEAADNGRVVGVVGPYLEPRLNVQVQTEFVGARRNGTITGVFTTRPVGSSGKGESGRWQMTKKP